MSETTILNADEFALTTKNIQTIASAAERVEEMGTTKAQVTVDMEGQPWCLTFGYDSTGTFGLTQIVIEDT